MDLFRFNVLTGYGLMSISKDFIINYKIVVKIFLFCLRTIRFVKTGKV